MNLLVIETSSHGTASASKEVSRYLVDKLKQTHATIVTRDLASAPLPHVSGEMVEAYFTPGDQRTAAQRAHLAPSDQVIDEVVKADAIVISAPTWNFGLPSALKAWVDHLVRAGRTFQYSSDGLKGLLDSNKKVFFIISSGSRFSSGPFSAFDLAVPSLKAALGFIGLTNVKVIRVEGTNDPVSSATAIEVAKQTIEKILA